MSKLYFWMGSAVLLLVLNGCSLKEYRLFQDESDTKGPTQISDEQYQNEMVFENKIVANDRVSIMVYNQAGAGVQQLTSMVGTDTSGASKENGALGFLVTHDGTVRLPLIGSQNIAGMTEDEAADYLINEYKKYLRNPYVTVKIENQRIYIIGEVNKPGVVQVYNGTMNIVEAIARSGDLTDYAERTNIKVLRGDLRNPEVRRIDLTQLSALKLSSLYLKPNDIIYVEPRDSKGTNIAIKEISPPFELLSKMLQPFVNAALIYKSIK